jgi:hypothetical protein
MTSRSDAGGSQLQAGATKGELGFGSQDAACSLGSPLDNSRARAYATATESAEAMRQHAAWQEYERVERAQAAAREAAVDAFDAFAQVQRSRSHPIPHARCCRSWPAESGVH